MKAPFLVRNNISALLAARKESASSLAVFVGKHKTWISQFLTGKRDELQLVDLDRIADFFGIATYQLFQPGISRLTERRSSIERRTGQERRIGHTNRLITNLQSELNKVPRFARGAAHDSGSVPSSASSVEAPVRAILADAERRIAAYYQSQSREQAAATRRKVSGAPRDSGRVRRSDPEQAK